MAKDYFVAKSEGILSGIIKDRVGDDLTLLDLTGATVKVQLRLNGGVVKEVTGTPDGDQVANKGEFAYQLTTTDLPDPGTVEMEVHVTSALKKHRSKIVGVDVYPTMDVPV